MTSPGINTFSIDCADAPSENMTVTISARLTKSRLIHVDSNNMNDSTKNQQVKKGEVNDVPIGKQPLPDGELGCLDDRVQISIDIFPSNSIIDD